MADLLLPLVDGLAELYPPGVYVDAWLDAVIAQAETGNPDAEIDAVTGQHVQHLAHNRGLAGAANSEVANRNDGNAGVVSGIAGDPSGGLIGEQGGQGLKKDGQRPAAVSTVPPARGFELH